MFAEVILPLPIQATYTYAIPEELAASVAAGSRVMVQFGKKKFYTGIVAGISVFPNQKEYEVKPIMALLDPEPITTRLQLKLWDWIADYYLSPLGDVMKAALPGGLRPESETKVDINPYWERSGEGLSELEAELIGILDSKGALPMAELIRLTDNPKVATVVNSLIGREILEVSERVVERYRPKRETMIRMTIPREDTDRLHSAMEVVARARKQERLLMAYLELSGWLRHGEDLKEVTKAELLEKAEVTPAVLKGLLDKEILEQYQRIVNRFDRKVKNVQPLSPLSQAQESALRQLTASMQEHHVTLLHGVTGSGKTEVYSHLIDRVLKSGRSVLFLVPEISLTTQLTDRLRKFFGDRLVVYHSKFTDNERVDIFRSLSEPGRVPKLILGVRSSVFLPVSDLGLVIVDEEHESSYKQFDPAPRYNARDTAIVFAQLSGAKVILGSATPSIETYYKATTGKYGLVSLTERFGEARLPKVEVIDMRDARKRKEVSGILSTKLKLATREVISSGKQAIMFQNRRGFAPVVICRQCGWTPKCQNCDVSLVYHKQSNMLRCHYCGFSRPLPTVCPACGVNDIDTFGYGTERIAEELHHQFEGFRVARMDLDTTRNKESQQEIIEEFANKETDILVGTQMVTKGLDFGGVELVGVLNADSLLLFPDFRANERAFNMLEQVSGRAGRRGDSGRVMIQTSRPEEEILKFVRNHDYDSHYRSEIADRERYGYPPFAKIIMVYLKNKDRQKVDAAAVILTNAMRRVFGQRVLGPEKPFVGRVATWYLQSIMLKVEATVSMKQVKKLMREIYVGVAGDPNFKGTFLYYDVDPA